MTASSPHPERPTRTNRAILLSSPAEFAAAAESALAERGAQRACTLLAVEIDAGAGADTQAGAIREQVVELVRRNLRATDVVSNVAGEVSVLLPGTPPDEGRELAQRLCAAIRNHTFATGGDRLHQGVTASIGVAAAPQHGTSFAQLAQVARAASVAVRDQGGDGAAMAGDRPTRRLEIGRFVGRTEELTTVRRLLDEATTGSPRAVSVMGEAGLGRVALLLQLEPEVRMRGGSLVVAHGRESGVRTPYGVWAEALRALQRLPDAPTKTWRELMHLHPDLRGSGEERAGSKFRLLEEISDYVRLASRSRPIVLVLDEMQWADAASWDALEHLLTSVERERLLVCLTMRDDPGQTEIIERRTALGRIDYYHEIRLSRLTRDEVKRWLEAAMQRQEIAREPLAYLYRHTEGNPLFMVQLVGCMYEEGCIRHNGERWEWSPVSELRLPDGLDEIIRRRVGRLSSTAQDVLSTAAIIGRGFDVAVLLGATGLPEEAVRAAIDDGMASGVLVPGFDRGGTGYSFTHPRVVAALVEALPVERVRRANEAVARALQDRPGTATATALHFDSAGCAPDAYQAGLEAASYAESVYSYEAAGDFLQIAARNAMSPGELAEVRVRLAHMAEILGRFDEVEELCDLAIEWFFGQGDRLRALTLRRMRERARRELGQPARVTLEALRALDEEAGELGSDRERIEILTMESQTYARLGDPRQAEHLAEECLAMAERLGDPALLAAALNRLGITIRNESPKRSREYHERALALFQRLGDVRGQARCHNNLGIVAQLEMRPDFGRDSLTMAMTLARAAGMPDLTATAALNLGVNLQRAGEYERARELYGDALASFAAVKNSELQLYALYNLANLDREIGDFESSAELYEATASLAQRIGQSDVEIGAMAGEGLCLLSLGRLDAVHVHSAEIEQRMASTQGWFQGRELVETLRVRAAAAEGRTEDAMAAFERALNEAEDFDIYSVAWLTAACAEQLMPHYPDQILARVQKYAGQVATLGFSDLLRKYQAIQGIPAEPARQP